MFGVEVFVFWKGGFGGYVHEVVDGGLYFWVVFEVVEVDWFDG